MVTGLQKPPAGSGEGEGEEEEMVPVGMRLLIWAGARGSLPLTGEVVQPRQLRFRSVSGALEGFQLSTQRCKGRGFPSKAVHGHRIPPMQARSPGRERNTHGTEAPEFPATAASVARLPFRRPPPRPSRRSTSCEPRCSPSK